MKTKIKICGIRDLESAFIAAANGADFLGFNFVSTSKRYIDSDKAKEIIEALREKQYQTKMVGIFQNASVREVNTLARLLNLDYIQLHGEENEKYITEIKHKIIKKITIDDQKILMKKNIAHFLLDRNIQGEGDMVDLNKAKKINETSQIFFSGGLTHDNVGDVIKKVNPFAVDVAGGIETNGKQDIKKIKQFINAVKEVKL